MNGDWRFAQNNYFAQLSDVSQKEFLKMLLRLEDSGKTKPKRKRIRRQQPIFVKPKRMLRVEEI